MTDLGKSFPIYQLNMDQIPKGDPSQIVVWRGVLYSWWENKFAQHCSPLHFRSINFLWKQNNAFMGNEIPEFYHVNNVATFNRRARRKEFPDDLIEGHQFSLNEVRIRENEQADIKPSTSAQTGEVVLVTATSGSPKYKFIRQHPDGEDELSNDIEFALVVACTAEVTGSIHSAHAFLDSFAHDIKTFDAFFNISVQRRIANTLEKTYTILQQTTPQRYVGCITRGGEFKNFNDLFNRICLDKGISNAKPSILLNLNFIADIPKAAEYLSLIHI